MEITRAPIPAETAVKSKALATDLINPDILYIYSFKKM
jgi:hypothetical protein